MTVDDGMIAHPHPLFHCCVPCAHPLSWKDDHGGTKFPPADIHRTALAFACGIPMSVCLLDADAGPYEQLV